MPLSPRASIAPLVLLVCAAVVTLPAYAQKDPAPPASPPATAPTATGDRPRIGIALAGGSALGEAHIGVLQWMDEHHIPVDYVAGTSMGGLVGGAYSCGYSPAELQALLSRVDWQDALRGDTPYPALAFRRKEDRRFIPNRFEFGLKHGLTLPGGLNPAHAIGLLLSEITYSQSTTKSFDDLPIPFRCIATDLRNGEAVVLKDGSLPVALRATMALPGIFTPVRRNGRLLSDGGIVQNLPTETVRDMGAQTIIAVDLNASAVEERDDKNQAAETLLSIIGRSVTLAVRANEQASLKIANIVIAPDLKELSASDFTQTDEFVKRGYAAAEAQKDKLLPLALSPEAWREYVAKRVTRTKSVDPRPDFLEIRGPEYGAARRIERQLRPILGKTFPSDDADERFTLLTGGGRYNAVLYEAIQNDAGQNGVRVLAQTVDYGPPFLRAGLELNGADTRAVQLNAVSRYIGLDAGFLGAETRFDVRLGSNVDLNAEYYVPIGGSESPFAIAPRVFYSDTSRNVFQNGSRTAVYGTQEVGAALDTVLIPNRFTQMRLGYQYSRFSSGLRTGTAIPTTNGDLPNLHFSFVRDDYDDALLPRDGTRLRFDGIQYLRTPAGVESFTTAEARYSWFRTGGRKDTAFALVSGGTTFGTDAPAPLQFGLGGPFRLGAFNTDALRGNDYYQVTGGILHQVSTPPLLGGRTLVGVWGELGGTYGPTYADSDSGSRLAISGGVISETLFGPLLLGVSAGNNGRGGIRLLPYFVLGRLF